MTVSGAERFPDRRGQVRHRRFESIDANRYDSGKAPDRVPEPGASAHVDLNPDPDGRTREVSTKRLGKCRDRETRNRCAGCRGPRAKLCEIAEVRTPET